MKFFFSGNKSSLPPKKTQFFFLFNLTIEKELVRLLNEKVKDQAKVGGGGGGGGRGGVKGL